MNTPKRFDPAEIFRTLGGTLLVGVLLQLASFFLGWTEDGSVGWAVVNALALVATFSLLLGFGRMIGQSETASVISFLAMGPITWVVLQTTGTQDAIGIWWLYCPGFVYYVLGSINASVRKKAVK